ncbi:MAG: alpha/beta fold hydrolase [Bacteroidota bacterium]|nr:alpha/beta fold hydrolase [Bacteroidota bacterium]MDP4231202.1 alpha/beta fold hydrolase [Bacteroidota bacterium]MDP4235331.1 alpha/beta fold hydrolase [Bacteroidota bacterium]
MMKKKKKLFIVLFSLFALFNVFAFIHAYKFTHYSSASSSPRTKGPDELSSSEKIATLFAGVTNPKPRLTRFPAKEYQTISLVHSDTIEAWSIPAANAKGIVILFHGYAGCKSDLLDPAAIFDSLGYSCVLVDFSGSGGSSGRITTLGVEEADEVRYWVDHIHRTTPSLPIYLYGVSMGAVSILRSQALSTLPVKAIILECPFESLLSSIKNRFDMMSVPSFGFAQTLAFWGGVQHGFWAFSHNSCDYAKKVSCPTLLLYGRKDRKVTMEETQDIYSALRVKKELVIFDSAGHDDDIRVEKPKWISSISSFLEVNK